MADSSERGGLRTGVYVDLANLSMNGGFGMRYDVLRDFACRDGAEPIRLNVYTSFDSRRAESDPRYRTGQYNFHSVLRDQGYKVILKQVKWYIDKETGSSVSKANVDLDLAVDALLQSENIDRVVLGTGDGDFLQVVRALQNRGCRVEVVAFDNVSQELRREADLFMPGYVIPNLLPIQMAAGSPPWGEIGSRVRGTCHVRDGRGGSFGFMRYLKTIRRELWRTDSRHPDSPYGSTYFHFSELPSSVDPQSLPSRDIIFEFQLVASGRPGETKAVDITWVNAPAEASKPDEKSISGKEVVKTGDTISPPT